MEKARQIWEAERMLFQIGKRAEEFLKKIHSPYQESYHKGEGVIIHKTKTGEIILENTIVHKEVMILNEGRILVNLGLEDIDFEKVDRLENPENARRNRAEYGFGIETYNNGAAFVWWTLYPDGRYFEDEDGFGGENCNETTVYAYMDTQGRILIPFQDMNKEEKKSLRKEAERRAAERKAEEQKAEEQRQ